MRRSVIARESLQDDRGNLYVLFIKIVSIQTDRGQEFFAYEVQERLMEHGIKFRPIKPESPHLNGKVERSQRTDLDEFYSSID